MFMDTNMMLPVTYFSTVNYWLLLHNHRKRERNIPFLEVSKNWLKIVEFLVQMGVEKGKWLWKVILSTNA
ncbi:MAG TPA: hypothetical protein DCE41_29155 [Cytophagales bacterium]|nr:hypothetical protein [Cytophagales bacterium]HAA18007.1 hypothetical protein [Cytophagales bacterium]HAP63085.1 hypothetical protein [Cytophagales bacterium]